MALVVYQPPLTLTGSSLTPRDPKTGSFVGLSNQGATCYLNSLLQTLYMTPEFRKAIFSWRYDKELYGEEEFCIPLQLQKLFGLLALGDTKVVDTKALTKSFGWEGSEVFQQQDVQELTRVLFDALEETFKNTALEHIIDDMYAGELIDYIQCIDVEYQSERKDKFLDLSFAIVPFGQTTSMHSLNECIEMFLKPEILNGDNKYYVETFAKKVDAIKGLKFGKLPQIMSCNLKRFVYDFSNDQMAQKKLNDIVKFPLILDMNKYVCKKKKKAATAAVSVAVVAKSTDDTSESPSDGVCDKMVEAVLADTHTSEGTGSDSDYETNTEFELFLGDQINSLLAKPPQSQRQMQNLDSEKPSSTNRSAVIGHLSGTSNQKANNTADELDEDDDIYKDMPDLTDYFGVKSKDQVMEENRSVPVFNNTIPLLSQYYRRYNMLRTEWTRDEVNSLLRERGEWIYELFAVLIHSGAISGGHYYAYIKDVDNNKWYNFNDEYVHEIDVTQVTEAWGSKITKVNSQTNFNHFSKNPLYVHTNGNINTNDHTHSGSNSSTTTIFGSSNAYMLMYRKMQYIDTTASIAKPLFPSRNDIPDYILTEYKNLQLLKQEKIKFENEMKNKCTVKIMFNQVETDVIANRNTTYEEFLAMLWDQFKLINHPNFVDLKSELNAIVHSGPNNCIDDSTTNQPNSKQLFDDPLGVNSSQLENGKSSVPFDRLRLRVYYHYNNTLATTYDYTKFKSFSIESLSFGLNKMFLLETRSSEEEFEEYYDDGVNVNIDEYNSELDIYNPTKTLRLRYNAKLSDLYERVARTYKKPISSFKLIKSVNITFCEVSFELLPNSPAVSIHAVIAPYTKLLLDFYTPQDLEPVYALENHNNVVSALSNSFKDNHYIINGDNSITKMDPGNQVTSPILSNSREDLSLTAAAICYTNMKASITIRYNKFPSREFTHTLKGDMRWTVGHLRLLLSKECGLSYEYTRLLKNSFTGMDLRDDNKKLMHESFYNLVCVCVMDGKLLPEGYHNIHITCFDPRFFKPYMHFLPPPPVTSSDDGELEESLYNDNSSPLSTSGLGSMSKLDTIFESLPHTSNRTTTNTTPVHSPIGKLYQPPSYEEALHCSSVSASNGADYTASTGECDDYDDTEDANNWLRSRSKKGAVSTSPSAPVLEAITVTPYVEDDYANALQASPAVAILPQDVFNVDEELQEVPAAEVTFVKSLDSEAENDSFKKSFFQSALRTLIIKSTRQSLLNQ